MLCVILGQQFLASHDKAFPVDQPKINPCQINFIVKVGGTPHKVQGVINMEVKFGI